MYVGVSYVWTAAYGCIDKRRRGDISINVTSIWAGRLGPKRGEATQGKHTIFSCIFLTVRRFLQPRGLGANVLVYNLCMDAVLRHR